MDGLRCNERMPIREQFAHERHSLREGITLRLFGMREAALPHERLAMPPVTILGFVVRRICVTHPAPNDPQFDNI